ncbi:hypothetical protein Tasa_048_048 [Tanticharoenia sakaeratensis NBRC 103193]|uniref:Uncharacterized protein n=1 Tax=Tanticharoenia sakaeratensis NBRC 103193 TaxID=1231623 RepID=A0A0D6MQ55_9PROT|nr:hypothetical protein Tasa_048_048 [Tanticharoenia sakaeratensis NBRC 103193]GBQ22106.1 hypothetical protein AA103193_1961 [Tanticharoenia sakaeratensis NBRC 103193]
MAKFSHASPMPGSVPQSGGALVGTPVKQDRYIVYLVVMALAGWALASYDVNLLVLALPDIATSLLFRRPASARSASSFTGRSSASRSLPVMAWTRSVGARSG